MTLWQQIALFYAVAGVIIGFLVSMMDKVSFNFRGKPAPYPRLFTFIVGVIVWPILFWQMVFGPRK